jgi:hypothetical protein
MPAATMSQTGDVADEDLIRTENMPFGQRVGAWVIHFRAVVCTKSPSTFFRRPVSRR